MIDIRQGQITDILPENLKSQMETQALAYALRRQMEKLCAAADKTVIYAAMAQAPEEILDYLALELRTPCYEMTFSVETKRRLIASTLPYYMKMGTTGMVNSIIRAIFGSGYIREFFEAGLEPHHFTVHITGAEETTRPTADLRQVLEQVKRKSQWLDAVELEFATMEHLERIGGVVGTISTTPVPEEPDTFEFRDTLAAGGTVGTITETPVPELPDQFRFRADLAAGGTVGTVTNTPVPEEPDDLAFMDRVNIGGGMGTQLTTPLAEFEEAEI